MNAFFTLNIDHSDNSIIRGRQQFSILINKAEISDNFTMVIESGNLGLVSGYVGNKNTSIIISSSDKRFLFSFTNSCDKNFTCFDFIFSLFRFDIIEGNKSAVSTDYDII